MNDGILLSGIIDLRFVEANNGLKILQKKVKRLEVVEDFSEGSVMWYNGSKVMSVKFEEVWIDVPLVNSR